MGSFKKYEKTVWPRIVRRLPKFASSTDTDTSTFYLAVYKATPQRLLMSHGGAARQPKLEDLTNPAIRHVYGKTQHKLNTSRT